MTRSLALGGVAVLLLSACATLVGIDDYEPTGAGGAGGAGGSGVTGSASGAGGSCDQPTDAACGVSADICAQTCQSGTLACQNGQCAPSGACVLELGPTRRALHSITNGTDLYVAYLDTPPAVMLTSSILIAKYDLADANPCGTEMQSEPIVLMARLRPHQVQLRLDTARVGVVFAWTATVTPADSQGWSDDPNKCRFGRIKTEDLGLTAYATEVDCDNQGLRGFAATTPDMAATTTFLQVAAVPPSGNGVVVRQLSLDGAGGPLLLGETVNYSGAGFRIHGILRPTDHDEDIRMLAWSTGANGVSGPQESWPTGGSGPFAIVHPLNGGSYDITDPQFGQLIDGLDDTTLTRYQAGARRGEADALYLSEDVTGLRLVRRGDVSEALWAAGISGTGALPSPEFPPSSRLAVGKNLSLVAGVHTADLMFQDSAGAPQMVAQAGLGPQVFVLGIAHHKTGPAPDSDPLTHTVVYPTLTVADNNLDPVVIDALAVLRGATGTEPHTNAIVIYSGGGSYLLPNGPSKAEESYLVIDKWLNPPGP